MTKNRGKLGALQVDSAKPIQLGTLDTEIAFYIAQSHLYMFAASTRSLAGDTSVLERSCVCSL